MINGSAQSDVTFDNRRSIRSDPHVVWTSCINPSTCSVYMIGGRKDSAMPTNYRVHEYICRMFSCANLSLVLMPLKEQASLMI